MPDLRIANPPRGRAILVIRGGALGDFILTLPVLAALRRHHPEARIELLGDPAIAGLALAGGLADAVSPLGARALAMMFAPDAALPPELEAFFSRFDLILSYLSDPERVFQRNVARLSPALFVAGPPRPDLNGARHAADALLDPLAVLGIVEQDSIPSLRLSGPDVSKGDRHWLALHPGSGSERKNWPEPGWTQLIPRLAAAGIWNLLLVGGEAEGDRLERLAHHCPPERLKVARSLPLVELASRLTACQFFIGHDSGITHLAAALGVPGLVLWGESPISVWRPRRPEMHCLEAGTHLGQLEVDTVWAALAPRLAVLPCRRFAG